MFHSKEPIPEVKEAFETMNEAEAEYHLSVWLGAVFIYFIFLGRKPFKALYVKKYHTRNLIVGYCLRLALVAGILALFYYLTVRYS